MISASEVTDWAAIAAGGAAGAVLRGLLARSAAFHPLQFGPHLGPALATLAIFVFLGSWNSFLWPLIVTNSIEMRTVPVGLRVFQGQFTTNYPLMMAAASMALVPILIIYVIGQKYFVRGSRSPGGIVHAARSPSSTGRVSGV